MRLLHDILDLSKIEAGKMELEQAPFHLPDVVIDAVRVLGVNATRKQIDLVCRLALDLPRQVVGDAGVRQVIVNLVGNAIKFTQAGEVFVNVEVLQAAAHSISVHFQIRDSGIGISADKQQRIFEFFPRPMLLRCAASEAPVWGSRSPNSWSR